MSLSPQAVTGIFLLGALGACTTDAMQPADADARFLVNGASGCHAIIAEGRTFSSFDISAEGPVPQQFYPLWDGGPPLVPGFQSDASISLAIDGIDASPGLVVTTKLLSQVVHGSGTTHALTSHVFELDGSDGDSICEPGEDCFQTIDRTVLTPTTQPGIVGLHGILAIDAGYGAFATPDRNPPLVALGQIGFAPAPIPTVASWHLHGNLCLADGF